MGRSSSNRSEWKKSPPRAPVSPGTSHGARAGGRAVRRGATNFEPLESWLLLAYSHALDPHLLALAAASSFAAVGPSTPGPPAAAR